MLQKVYPHFSVMPHGLVHESEEKLRAHFLHTGILSAPGLYADPTRLSADNVSERVKFREKNITKQQRTRVESGSNTLFINCKHMIPSRQIILFL